eukprot:CAMPEP_0184486930 /NCGR_PEP_ID=MMETSP0113_2-20130426/8801_1 /TAXON_ID=91329 /ORGANISM="Norrisiella sphaerica, Strain BC52" /LENGTH=90 /DNA_ID=CAMNT_0026869017 /DNA_START=80 /DNA_END=352 /DNA_ORIENTATION=-
MVQVKVAQSTLEGYAIGIQNSLANPEVTCVLKPHDRTEIKAAAVETMQWARKNPGRDPPVYYKKQESLKKLMMHKIEEGAQDMKARMITA